MRAVIFILIIAVLVLLAAIASGFLNVNQTRGAQVPNVSTTGNGVTAQGGQAPAFQVETGSLKVGAKDANVKLPTVQVNRPAGGQPPQPAPAQPEQPGNAQ